MAIYKSDIVDINLESGSIHRSFMKHSIGTADQAADRFGIRAFRNGEAVDLSGASCYGYFRDPQGNNIALTSNGTVDGNVAYVTLPQACYNYEGNFTLTIKLLVTGVTSTVRIIDGVVDNTNTGSAVAPTSAVPTYSEILSQYDDMVAATAVANGAIATTFNAATVYPAGSYVINSGALYRITADHAANVTWANTSKVATNFGAEVSSLKSAINYIDLPFTKVSGNVFKDENNQLTFPTNDYWYRTAFSVVEGERYTIQLGTMSYGTLIPYIFLCNDNIVVSSINNNTINVSQIENHAIVIPSGINKVYIRSYERYDTEDALSVKKVSSDYEQTDVQKTKVDTTVLNGTVTSGHFDIGETIEFDTNSAWKHTSIIANPGEEYELTYKSFSYSTLISYVYLCDKDNKIIQVFRNFMPSASYVEKIRIRIPSGIAYVYVRSYESDSTNISEVYKIQNPSEIIGTYPIYNQLILDSEANTSFSSVTVGSKIAFSSANDWSLKHFEIKPGEVFSIKYKTLSYGSTIAYVAICDENDIVLARINNSFISRQGMEEVAVYGESTYKRVYVRSYKGEAEVYQKMPSISEIVEIALKAKPFVYIACSDAPNRQKSFADIILNGTTDELVIQKVINDVCALGGGTIKLSSGTVYINSFPNKDETLDDYVALMIPQTKLCELFIEGDSLNPRTSIRVTPSCYEALDDNTQYTILRGSKTSGNYTSSSNIYFRMQDFEIRTPWNQKKIRCLDMLYCNKVLLERITIRAWVNGYDGHYVSVQNPPAVSVEGCEGIRATGGSNWGEMNDYRNITVAGFNKGFRMSGEHMVCINCGALFCVYGWAFGDYVWTGGSNHPMTLLHCYDERNVNFPLFDSNGESGNPNHTGQQAIYFIGFSAERIATYTPGGILGDYAKELYPGVFRGEIEYTIQDVYGGHGNSVDMPFWEDGSGHGFVSRNTAQLLSCDSTTRLSYAPNFLQRIWDTTLNKEVICIDPANKTWVDVNGNNVDA